VRDMAHDTGEPNSQETDSVRHGAGKRTATATADTKARKDESPKG
jgi:hypothetical protein